MKNILASFLIGTAFGLFLYGVMNQSEPIIGEKSKDILGATTATVACDQIKIHAPKKKKKKELGLPEEIQKDKDISLADAIRINADGRDHVVSALFNSKNSDISLYDAPQPLPWLKTSGDTFVSAHYGIKSDEGSVWRITAGQTLVRVKMLNVNVMAQADTDGDVFGGIGVEYRF